jgi:hypothetical protein
MARINLTPMITVMHATAMGIGPNRFILWGRFEDPCRTVPALAGEARDVARGAARVVAWTVAGDYSATATSSEMSALMPTLKSKRSRQWAANKKVVENPKWILN